MHVVTIIKVKDFIVLIMKNMRIHAFLKFDN